MRRNINESEMINYIIIGIVIGIGIGYITKVMIDTYLLVQTLPI